eukprot:7788226-Karenia_brevis.AAC.1
MAKASPMTPQERNALHLVPVYTTPTFDEFCVMHQNALNAIREHERSWDEANDDAMLIPQSGRMSTEKLFNKSWVGQTPMHEAINDQIDYTNDYDHWEVSLKQICKDAGVDSPMTAIQHEMQREDKSSIIGDLMKET